MDEIDYTKLSREQLLDVTNRASKYEASQPVTAGVQAPSEEPNPVGDYYKDLQKSTFEKFADTAGNTAVAASQAVQQGADNLLTGTRLGFKQIFDKLGFTDPTATEKEYANLQARQATTDASAEKLGHPWIAKAAQLGTEVAGASLLTGGMGTVNRVRELVQPVAGKLLGYAAGSGVSAGAYTASQYDPNGLESRAVNTGLTTAIGAGMPIATSVLGKTVNSGVNWATQRVSDSKISEQAVKAFNKVNEFGKDAAGKITTKLQPLASELQGNKLVRHTLEIWENALNSIPGLGIIGRTGRKHAVLDNNFVNYAVELDKGVLKTKELANKLYTQVSKKIPPDMAFDMSNVQKTVKSSLDEVANSITGLSPSTARILKNIQDRGSLTFEQLKATRGQVFDVMKELMQGKRDTGWQNEYKALNTIRDAMSVEMENIAMKAGTGATFQAAQKAYKDRIAMEVVAANTSRAFTSNRVGATDVGKAFDGKFTVAGMNIGLNKAKVALKAMGLTLPKDAEDAFHAFRVVGNTINQSAAPKKTALSLSVAGRFAGTVGAGLAGGAIAGLPAVVATGALIKGMSLMMSTDTGIRALSKFGNALKKAKVPEKVLETAGARGALIQAIMLGHADNIKDPENAHRDFPSTMLPNYDNLNREQLLEIINQPDGQ